ncbi:hypothetical protein EDD18DRAFT_1184830 [Armillaria luteobubalina]|uniref:BTB domain-containing protein n=1 Tax=Armillaria luteobubalina TaxID=153913 RepID=A0AA39PY28_9AGAR|nr:hypothetical protein EDD18DRAFT_1184830 [Armillaria luteobubalina]
MYQAPLTTDETLPISSDNVAGNNIYDLSLLDLNPFGPAVAPRHLSDTMALGVPSPVGPGNASESTAGAPITPLSSGEGRPNNKESVADVSTTFFPGTTSMHQPADIILISSDNIHFNVHFNVLYDASNNGLSSLLPITTQEPGIPVLNLPEQSDILNIILLTIYGKPIADYRPAFEVILTAVDSLERYGIQPQRYVKPAQPLFELLHFHIPHHPLDIYVLAAHYDLFQLAEAASSHLLSTALDTITEAQSMRMGAVYLKRLYDLHSRRIDALKNILIRSPEPHPSTRTCSLSDQNGVSRAWALSAAYLIWDARPDMSFRYIESTMGALKQHVSCDDCKETIDAQVRKCIIDWTSVKWSI